MAHLHEIPGTPIFDGAAAQKGYALNRMCFSFNEKANRDAFAADDPGHAISPRPAAWP